MGSLSEDLWENILTRLSVKNITASKVVCKQWKSIVESPFFRELFLSRHKNSHSSWSLICRDSRREVGAHYGCEIWGLERSLGSYVSSFLADRFGTQKEKVRVLAYTDVGLILVGFRSSRTYYVANPISRQCVKLPPRPFRPLQEEIYKPGLATRIDKDVLLGYKVIVMDTSYIQRGFFTLVVYSSETGLWSYKNLHCDSRLNSLTYIDPITLNGNIYWFGVSNSHDEVLVSHDLYAESDRCRILPYPDVGLRQICTDQILVRCCTISQEYLMYMNVVYENQRFKLCLWRLKSGEWNLVSAFPVASFNYFPLAINPFDGNTMYMWSKIHGHFASTDFYTNLFRLHNNLERSCNGRTLSFAGEWNPKKEKDNLYIPFTSRFVLPRWLHRIPSSPS